ncbi:MAG TPA: DUF2270 domain-containing protein [Opitutaceae bacterium]
MSTPDEPKAGPPFNAAEIGALAHLYRGELYRSKIWRTRLDTTTNWAVATTGIALSVSFSSSSTSPLPLLLVGLLVMVFLIIEGRRYRYFDIWRARVRVLEVCFFGPVLRGEGVSTANNWNKALASDYARLRFHITYWEALGRRLRRNYAWILGIQAISYLAKICIHPSPIVTLDELWERAAIGPIPGQAVLALGVLFHCGWIACSVLTLRRQHAVGRALGPVATDDPIDKLGVSV